MVGGLGERKGMVVGLVGWLFVELGDGGCSKCYEDCGCCELMKMGNKDWGGMYVCVVSQV